MKASRWILEIRGKDHNEALEDIRSEIWEIRDYRDVEISLDKEVDFSKAKRAKFPRLKRNI